MIRPRGFRKDFTFAALKQLPLRLFPNSIFSQTFEAVFEFSATVVSNLFWLKHGMHAPALRHAGQISNFNSV